MDATLAKEQTEDTGALDEERLDALISETTSFLKDRQAEDGHWVFELEADVTIPAEYILLNHFIDEIDDETEAKLGVYIRATQEDHGGWPLFHRGDLDVSASVKAYYALKLIGEDVDAPHMKKAREAILAHGGAARSNVFTRIALALFGQIPWRGVPMLRTEVMLLPKWFFFHIDKVSYWSRTVMVPLLILNSLKAQAENPRNVGIEELFVTPPDKEKKYITNPTGHWLGSVLLVADRIGRIFEPLLPKFFEKKGVDAALAFVKERLNGEDGLGGIFPAMANTLMAYHILGLDRDHPDRKIVRKSVDKLLILSEKEGRCQPCLSPIWDTGLIVHTLMEVEGNTDNPCVDKANKWMKERQILELVGDWKANRGHVRPGGWAFQYWNDYYPDVDDTAVVAMGMHRSEDPIYKEAIERAAEWIIGMQSKNGGWGAFDADNEHYFLLNIPFSDHGALLDPPSVDVAARCISMLAQLGYANDHPTMAAGLEFLRSEQEEDGSWFGRWGTNYIYGAWSALCALNVAGEDQQGEVMQKAVRWLKSVQREDGGWGEDCTTYWEERRGEVKISTPSQTAWALLALMAVGEVDSDAVKDGIAYLLSAPRTGGKWDEDYYNAVGFPRVFYLSYHGYSAYFPLWALARYRNLRRSDTKAVAYGM
jgi:squalene-hopene/tetraprenyl-beta-curcumene cyclase